MPKDKSEEKFEAKGINTINLPFVYRVTKAQVIFKSKMMAVEEFLIKQRKSFLFL